MKNIKLKKILMFVALISILPITLAGCKKFVPNTDFDSSFGSREDNYSGFEILDPVLETDTIQTAIQKINKNYSEYNYVSYKGKVEGQTISAIKIKQAVYSTFVREKKPLGTKVYHEDAAVANKSMVHDGIVRVYQTFDHKGEGKVIVKNANRDTIMKNEDLDYPTSVEYSADNFTYDEYLAQYYQDFNHVVPFDLTDINAVDESKSHIKKIMSTSNEAFNDDPQYEKQEFIEVFITLDSSDSAILNKTTLEKRQLIALKSRSNGIDGVTENDVTFIGPTTIEFRLWPDGYIRHIKIYEKYTINTSGFGSQTCEFNSSYYYSNSPNELPMDEMEKEFNKY